MLLILVGAVRIARSGESQFELQRRANDKDKTAQAALARDMALVDLLSLQRAIMALLVVGMTVLAIAAYGWLIGGCVAVGVVLVYGVVARQTIVHRVAQARYTALEPRLIGWTTTVPLVWWLLRSVTVDGTSDPALTSKEQLLHLIDQSHGVMTQRQKTLLRHGLEFADKKVTDVMTPRSAIDSIAATELLGPLVLDDLHKTGHSRFPVVEVDIDHVVGMLYVRDLLVLDGGKRTMTAEKAMNPHVVYIKESQSLSQALTAFLSSHHHVLIVVNEYRETVGLISLQDVIEALIGHKIVDEFDTHDDLRAVAARHPQE